MGYSPVGAAKLAVGWTASGLPVPRYGPNNATPIAKRRNRAEIVPSGLPVTNRRSDEVCCRCRGSAAERDSSWGAEPRMGVASRTVVLAGTAGAASCARTLSRAAIFGSVLDTRVEIGIREVGGEIGKDEHQCPYDHRALRHRVVAVEDPGQGVAAESGQREQLFHDNRSAQ